jgi:outer membrane scaffolding protein for murein synthesis (MipA/OmpV family)
MDLFEDLMDLMYTNKAFTSLKIRFESITMVWRLAVGATVFVVEDEYGYQRQNISIEW